MQTTPINPFNQTQNVKHFKNNSLSNENTKLKLRLQAMEQQAQLRDGMFQLSTFKQTFSNFYLVLHTQY